MTRMFRDVVVELFLGAFPETSTIDFRRGDSGVGGLEGGMASS